MRGAVSIALAYNQVGATMLIMGFVFWKIELSVTGSVITRCFKN